MRRNLPGRRPAGPSVTRTANARLAGFAFLFYIVAGITSLSLAGWTPPGGTPVRRRTAVDYSSQ